MIFIFQLANVVYHNDLFAYIYKPFIPEISLTWSQCIIILMCCGFYLVAFWREFHLHSSVILACNFFRVCDIFVWFWYQGDGGLVELVWEWSLPLEFFRKSLRRIDVRSKCLIEFSCEAVYHWPLFLEDFCSSLFQFPYLWFSVHMLYFFLVHYWKLVVFQVFFHFFQGCPFNWHIVPCNKQLFATLMILCIVVSISLFSFLFLFILVSLFFPCWVWLMICQFCLFSQRSTF